MLGKPDVPDDVIRARLAEHFGLGRAGLEFLPIGNDVNTAVYRVTVDEAGSFFLKLRSGDFDA